jgi:hypothetical protein
VHFSIGAGEPAYFAVFEISNKWDRSKIYNYQQPTYRTYPIDFRDTYRITANPPAMGRYG